MEIPQTIDTELAELEHLVDAATSSSAPTNLDDVRELVEDGVNSGRLPLDADQLFDSHLIENQTLKALTRLGIFQQ